MKKILLMTAALAAMVLLLSSGGGYALADHLYWRIETVDTAEAAEHTSLALDSSDNARISYSDSANGDLRYAYYDGSYWNIMTVATGEWAGQRSISLAVDSSDNPHISYVDSPDYAGGPEHLKHARYDGADWTITTVDSGPLGERTSLALDSSDKPHISYSRYDYFGGAITYAYYDGADWTITIADIIEGCCVNQLEIPSLALDSNDNPHISYALWYSGYPFFHLKYAHYDGADWNIMILDDSDGLSPWTSIAIDSTDNPRVSYVGYDYLHQDQALRYAYYDGAHWNILIADTADDYFGDWACLALDSADNPHITYSTTLVGHPMDELRYAYYDGADWNTMTVDSDALGEESSLALDSRDNPHVSYFDIYDYPHVSGEIKHAHLAPPPVGGIARLPGVADSSARSYMALAVLGAAALVALSAGGWYARRRLLR